MSRQIKSNSRQRLNPPAASDNFKDRLIKMIPAEVVAAYLACHTAITQFGGKHVVYWIVLSVVIVLMPFYLKRIMNVTDVVQIIIMAIAFVLWCATLQQPFDQLFNFNLNQQKLFTTLALTIFTFAVPIFYKGV